jgi:hypothetical protein
MEVLNNYLKSGELPSHRYAETETGVEIRQGKSA